RSPGGLGSPPWSTRRGSRLCRRRRASASRPPRRTTACRVPWACPRDHAANCYSNVLGDLGYDCGLIPIRAAREVHLLVEALAVRGAPWSGQPRHLGSNRFASSTGLGTSVTGNRHAGGRLLNGRVR